MAHKTHDYGWLKRVDRGDGKSDMVDGFGKIAFTIDTALIEGKCDNLSLRRFRSVEVERADRPLT